MKMIIASDIHGSAYWCGKLMETIEQENPEQIILLGDLLYHGPRNDLPRDYAPKQVMYLCADISQLKQDTGFEPKTEFEDGIREILRLCE